jgi:hypothetical protein
VFLVKVSNQGQNNEFNVQVDVAVTGVSFHPPTISRSIGQTTAGQASQVSITLPATPPKGVALRVRAFVHPVPGERDIANNVATYLVIFQ